VAARLVREQPPPIEKLLKPFQRFQKTGASGGIALLVATVIALIWANSPWGDVYEQWLHVHITFGFGDFVVDKSLQHWINDGLMVVFFFVVGLEIKRELLVGELASPGKAMLPMLAALGGIIGPAVIYVAINWGSDDLRGWGVPVATDIAFAIGVLSLLGSRIPIGLKVFLTALAIVDDIAAVLIIAVFYTEDISLVALMVGGGFFAAMIAANVLGVRQPLVYLLLGIGMWFGFDESGVHATVAGVISAFAIPASMRIDEAEFMRKAETNLDRFKDAENEANIIVHNERRQSAVHALEQACEQVQPPLLRLEHMLLPWVAFFIMPVFALANAGVSVGRSFIDALLDPVAIGIGLGLVLGKQLGIMLASFLCVKLGFSVLPRGCTWRHIYGAACLAGIGFTMSLFIAALAFDPEQQLPVAKVGILSGSLLAGVIGLLVLRFVAPKTTAPSGQAGGGQSGSSTMVSPSG